MSSPTAMASKRAAAAATANGTEEGRHGRQQAAEAPAQASTPLVAAVSAPAALPTVAAPELAAAAAAEVGTPPRRAGGGFTFAETAGSATPVPLGNPVKLQPPAPHVVARKLSQLQSGAAAPLAGAAATPPASLAVGNGQQLPLPQLAGTQPSSLPRLPALRAPPQKSVAFSPTLSTPGSFVSSVPPVSPLSASPGTPLEGRVLQPGGGPSGCGAAHKGTPLPSPSAAPVAFLEAVLARVAALDGGGYFDEPVDEAEAPRYHDFVKEPMSFRAMRERVRGRRYRTWRQLAADFELLCANALAYNQRRSDVRSAAAALLRTGRIVLQAAEPQGRIAIAALHPQGPAAAEADAKREAAGGLNGGLTHPATSSPSAPASPRQDASGPVRSASGDTAATPDTATGGAGFESDDEGYSSFSDMEPDPAPPSLWSRGGAGDAGAACAMPPLLPSRLPSVPSLVATISEGVRRVQWPEAVTGIPVETTPAVFGAAGAALGAPCSGLAGAAPLANGTTPKAGSTPKAGGTPRNGSTPRAGSAGNTGSRKQTTAGGADGGVAKRKGRTGLWRAASAGIEWRARWLQLRMRALAHQRDRHAEALAQLRSRGVAANDTAADGDAAAAAGAAPNPPAAAAPRPATRAAAPAAAAVAPAAAAAAVVAGDPATQAGSQAAIEAAATPPLKQRHRRLPVPGVGAGDLDSHPWFAAHAALGMDPTSQQRTASEGASDHHDVWYAGRCYALLEILERQRIATRRIAASICQAQDADAAATGRKSGSGGRNRSGTRPASARARGAAHPSKTASGKRRRDDSVCEPGTPLLQSGVFAPKFVERQQAMEIPLPQVRRLASSELSARRAAVLTWRARLRAQSVAAAASGSQSAAGLSPPPSPAADAAAVANPAAGKSAGGSTGPMAGDSHVRRAAGRAADPRDAPMSSEEESGDEVFEARHRPLELEERQRFMTYSGVPGQMKARAKGNPHGPKPKPSGGGNPRSGGGGRPDSAPARTATAPAAMMAPPAARTPRPVSPHGGGGGDSQGAAAAAGSTRRNSGGGGGTRRNSREESRSRSRSRPGSAGRTRAGDRGAAPSPPPADAAAAAVGAPAKQAGGSGKR